MTEHLTDRQIESYQNRTIRTAELLGLDRHVAVCAECRQRLSALVTPEEKFLSLKKALDSEAADRHPDDKHLAAYVDGLLEDTEAEITESHLAVCEKCHLMASDLSVFKDEIAIDLDRVYAPAPDAAMVRSAGILERLTVFLKSVFGLRSPALAVGFVTALLFIIGVTVLFTLRSRQSDNPAPQVARNPDPTPVITPTPLSSPQDDVKATPTPEATPQALLALNDGARRIAIDEQGNLTGLDELSPAHRQAVKNGLTTQQVVNASALAGISGQRGALRGGSDGSAFAPLNPVGKVVLTDRPTFIWNRLDGATAYRVVVYDSNFNPVSSSPQLTANSWRTPNALKRGEIYSWQAIATKDGEEVKAPVPPAAEARFKVLEQGRAQELERARRSYGNSHLALGVLYAQAGLLEEAERELSLLLKANPDSNVVRNLLRNVRAMRRAR